MTLSETALPPMLLHGAFFLFLTAYLLQDILWLRTVTVLGYLMFTILAVIRGGNALIELMPWYIAFMTINAVQMALLVRERWLEKLSPEEEELWAAFPAVDKVVFKRFIRMGEWRNVSDGYVFTTEEHQSSRLYLVRKGRVTVDIAGQRVTELGAGKFVGEIGFISGRPATATAVASAPADEDGDGGTHCVVWSVPKLRKQMQRNGELRSLVLAAVGSDLAFKISQQTVVAQKCRCAPADAPAIALVPGGT